MSCRSPLPFVLAASVFSVEVSSVEPSGSSRSLSRLNLALFVVFSSDCDGALRFFGFLGCASTESRSVFGDSDPNGILLAVGLAGAMALCLRGHR
jgi:hypothetical protein